MMASHDQKKSGLRKLFSRSKSGSAAPLQSQGATASSSRLSTQSEPAGNFLSVGSDTVSKAASIRSGRSWGTRAKFWKKSVDVQVLPTVDQHSLNQPNPTTSYPEVPEKPASVLSSSEVLDTELEDASQRAWKEACRLAKERVGSNEWPEPADNVDPKTILKDAHTAKAEKDNKKWRYSKQLDRIIKGLDTYAKVIDVAINQNPEITSLVWGAIRFLLQLYLNHAETMAKLDASLETISGSMAKAEYYHKFYEETFEKTTLYSEDTTQNLGKILASALPEFYCAVLVFAVKAKGYFAPSNWQKFTNPIKPFGVVLQPLLEEIKEKETALKEAAEMAQMRLIKGTAQSQELRKLEGLMVKVNEQLSAALNDGLIQPFSQISDKKALAWLDATDADVVLRVNEKHHMEGTCEWILKEPEYTKWLNETGSNYLWVVGIPGAGKSVLSASMVGELRKIDGAVALYFFFRNGDLRTTSSLQMAASLTAQLINSTQYGPDRTKLLEVLKRAVENGLMYADRGRSLDKIWAVFLDMLRVYRSKVVILLDALDECSDPRSVAQCVLLSDVVNVGTRFLVTGRPIVRDLFEGKNNVSTIKMDVKDDISKFIEQEVAQLPNLKRHAQAIITTINDNSAGMFRYAALVLDELKKPSSKKVSERLKIMPKGISGMYELILRRLGPRMNEEEEALFGEWEGDDEEHTLRQKVLMWVAVALRPMSIAEMQYACVTQPGIPFEPDELVLPDVDQMLKACGSMVEVFDEDKLRFTHLTVKEFLLADREILSTQDERISSVLVREPDAHASIALSCVTQLLSEGPLDTPFSRGDPLTYAVECWVLHAAKVTGKQSTTSSEELWNSVENLFWGNSDQKFERWLIQASTVDLSLHPEQNGLWRPDGRSAADWNVLPVHIAAAYGLEEPMRKAISRKDDLNICDEDGQTPLHHGTWCKAFGTVKLLLEQSEVDVNRCDQDGWPVLTIASINGMTDFVKLLLNREDLNLDLLFSEGCSALGCAVEKRHKVIVELLKARGATVSKCYGRKIELRDGGCFFLDDEEQTGTEDEASEVECGEEEDDEEENVAFDESV